MDSIVHCIIITVPCMCSGNCKVFRCLQVVVKTINLQPLECMWPARHAATPHTGPPHTSKISGQEFARCNNYVLIYS